MTFVVSGTVEIDGDAAKAEVKNLGNEVRRTGDAAGDFAGKGRAAAATATAIATQNRIAAGNVANLTAQFNDIGVMMAAGQNPLQLALQQGAQITQVLGPLGAAGSVRALSAAFVGMINPVSLATLGIIAGSAALVQWATDATSASGTADDFAKKLEAAREAQAALNEEVRGARLGVSAEELVLLDAIANKKREVKALEDELSAGVQRGRRNAPRELEIAQQERDLLEEQLATLRRQQTEKDTLLAQASELADQERLLGQQMTQTGGELATNQQIAKLLKEGISASVIQAMQLAGVDMASPISSAAAQAAVLATNLGIAYGEAVKLNAARNAPYVSSGRGGDPRQFDSENRIGNVYTPSPAAVAEAANLLRPPRTSRGRGGGISEIERQQQAVDDLITSLTQQRDIIRETDPVQKEMIQNRKVLATATAAERQQVEDLIAARLREEEAIAQSTERADFYGNVLSDALGAAAERGAELDDILKKVAGSFIDAGIQAAIFGTGPFGDIFGGVGIFDFLTPQKKAGGGMIYGAGGSTEDRVPVMASPGEFVVNANATARNRALLEAINAGSPVRGLARGGAVDGNAARSPSSTSAGATTINIDVTGARGNQEIMEAVREGIVAAIEEFSRNALPDRVAEISDNPRFVG